jgi:D-alanyl-D-alanine carboxypeptidase/D-alanyl-D-alanine-endopeptidase (penicillin-binding protein 4)
MAAKDHPQSLTRAARAALLIALAAPFPGTAGAQRVPFADLASAPAAMARRRAAMDQLATRLSSAIGGTGRSGTWGVLVVSLTNGDTLFGFNPDRQLLPASTMKLFTSALALDQFGPAGRFETQVLRSGTLRPDGTLDGDLVLRGAGDPTLGGRFTDDAGAMPMATLARSVAAAGVRRVSGALVGDASGFDDAKVPDGWRRRYLHASYAARVSALSFNENQVIVLVRPSGRRAEVSFRPAVSGVEVSNDVKVLTGSRGASIRVRQDSVAGRIKVSGWIGAKSPERDYKLVVENPELFAVGALRAALAAEGVTVDGPIRIATPRDPLTPVATLPSPTLDRIIEQMNGESNNHYAELLFRNVARAAGAPGSAETANSLLGRFLRDKVRAAPDAVFAADGSGLSTLDRVTPRAMVQLLSYAREASWGQVLEQSLPVAGQTETLRRRMRRSSATGNLHAKTGTTNDVASLGGYVTASNGEDLVFSVIYNGGNRWRARDTIDQIGVMLASFSR